MASNISGRKRNQRPLVDDDDSDDQMGGGNNGNPRPARAAGPASGMSYTNTNNGHSIKCDWTDK
jgi:hypothetical protein